MSKIRRKILSDSERIKQLKTIFWYLKWRSIKGEKSREFKEFPMHALCAYACVWREGEEKFQTVNGFYN